MRGVTIDSRRFRQIRIAGGLTQRELAVRAGVGERTVRNAEAGRPVRLDFARYLAAALGVEVKDVVRAQDGLRFALTEEEQARRVSTALLTYFRDSDLSEMKSLVANDVRIKYPDLGGLPISGEYRGIDGIRRILNESIETVAYDKPFTISEIRSSGRFVILSGIDYVRSLATEKTIDFWWQHVYEFDEGRVARIDALVDTHKIMSSFSK